MRLFFFICNSVVQPFIPFRLCLKDLEYMKRAVADEVKDVKKTPGSKLSALFTSTMEKVEAMLLADKPVRNGVWTSPEVRRTL